MTIHSHAKSIFKHFVSILISDWMKAIMSKKLKTGIYWNVWAVTRS